MGIISQFFGIVEPAKRKGIEGSFRISGPTRMIPNETWMRGDDYSPAEQLPRPYANHAYVYACIRAIAQNISQVPFTVQVGNARDAVAVSDEDPGPAGDLARVFSYPNDYSNRYHLWELTLIFLNLDGTAVHVLDRDNLTEIPKNIWVFRKTGFIPIVSEDGKVLIGWIYQDARTGKRIPLTTDQVIIIKFSNPYDSTWGMAPLEAAIRGVTLDYLANTYGRAFFENSADPTGVITAEKRLTKKQMEELRDFWETRHRGPGNAKKVGVLWGGMKYQATAMSHKDMEFLGQRSWTRDEILAVFKVPKSELSLYEDVNHATSLSQDKGFWQKTLIPIIRNIEATYHANLVQDLQVATIPKLRLVFDLKTVPALQEQLTEKITNAKKLAEMGYPVNDINEVLQLGMPRVPWGDTWYVNQAVVPIDFVLGGLTLQTTSPKPSGETVDAPAGSNPSDAPNSGEENSLAAQLRARMAQYYAQKRKAAPVVDLFNVHRSRLVKEYKTVLYRMRSEVLEKLVTSGHIVLDASKHMAKLNARCKTVLDEFCREQGKDPVGQFEFAVVVLFAAALKRQELCTMNSDEQMAFVKSATNAMAKAVNLDKLAGYDLYQLRKVAKNVNCA